MKNCYICNGKTKNKKVDLNLNWRGEPLVLRDIPVEICSNCGERFYSSEVSKLIDKKIQLKPPGKPSKVSTAIFSSRGVPPVQDFVDNVSFIQERKPVSTAEFAKLDNTLEEKPLEVDYA